MKTLRLVLLVAFSIVLVTGHAHASPAVNSWSGTSSHRQTVTMNGSGFGDKSIPGPVFWDDGEDKDIVSNAAVAAVYAEALPKGSSVDSEHKMQYRTIPYRSMVGPHARGSKYLAGGQWDTIGDCASHAGQGITVAVTYDLGSGKYSNTWYATWYERLDDSWPACTGGENFKQWSFQAGGASMTGANTGSIGINAANSVCSKIEPLHLVNFNDGSAISYGGKTFNNNTRSGGKGYLFDINNWGSRSQLTGTCSPDVDNWGPYTNSCTGAGPNPAVRWVRMEVVYDKISGVYGQRGWGGASSGWYWMIQNVPGFTFSPIDWNVRSFSVGAFWAKQVCGSGGTLDENAYRYFGDIYIDTSLARVVLTDNSDYDKSTIMEPQIPGAWSDTSVTFAVNLGALPDSGTVYAFVFDASNNRNSVGFPITVGQVLPQAPVGLRVIQ
jgi:hypothetical protein